MTRDRTARWALWLILAGALAALLALNLPGHMTTDSVLALHEGRFGLTETWNPAIFGWLLGLSDRVIPGPAGVVVASGLMLFGSLALLPVLRPRTSWLAPAVTLLAISLPQLMIYPAIVWKDVLFADAVICAFVILALSLPRHRGAGVAMGLALSAVLLAVAGLLRQNGLLFAIPAALAIAWSGWPRGPRSAMGVAAGWLAAVVLLTLVISATARPHGAGRPDDAGLRGLRILMIYDIVGAAALEPDRPTPRIDAAAPAAGDYIRSSARRAYSAERVEALDRDTGFGRMAVRLRSDVLRAEWMDLVTRDTGLYLRTRLQAFWQVLATPNIDHCLAVQVGLDGPAATLRSLGLKARRSAEDQRLYNYVTWHLDTPSLSHLAYGLIAAVVAGLLLLRREPPDMVIAALLVGALGFTASFFVLSLACDYRYLYVLDLAAIAGLIYWTLDPRLRRSTSVVG